MHSFVHYNFNVLNLNKSIDFYDKALGLKELRRKESDDGSFIIVYLGDSKTEFTLELTWLRDWVKPYNLGDNEFHLAFVSDDFEKSYELHSNLNCICYENKKMGIYFICDPDGYWLEILPKRV